MKNIQLDDLIKSLYGALVQPTGFSDFLTELITRFDLIAGSIVMTNNKLDTTNIIWIEGLNAVQAANFFNQHKQQDPLITLLNEVQPGKLITMGDAEAAQTQQSHPNFFKDLNNALDIYYVAAVVLANDNNWVSQLFFQRSKNQGEFSFEECLVLQQLIPHIQHAMQLYHLKLKQDKRNTLTGLLFDQIQLPVILLDESGYITKSNQKAKLFLDQSCSLKAINTQLFWSNDRVNERIKQVIELCNQKQSVETLQLDLQDHTAITLTFVPLMNTQITHENGIALFIYNQCDSPFDLDILCELYGLSKKEGLICKELINGHSPAEIAQATYLSYETVRTYIKHIMKKTDTKRQNELVAKILASPACNLLNN